MRHSHNQNLQNLPPTQSSFWKVEGADVQTQLIDMSLQKNVICGKNPEDHAYKINYARREATCERCGHGFVFQIHQVECRDSKLFLKMLDGSLKRIA